RIHGALEHHGDLAPAEAAQFVIVEREHVTAADQDLAALANERRRAMQPADREGDGALAAARFPGKAEKLALCDLEADVPDGVEVCFGADIVDVEIADGQDGIGHSLPSPRRTMPTQRASMPPVRRRGLAISSMAKLMSASPSPSSARAKQGASRSHQAPTERAEAFWAL